jgi:hypothetical protein
LGAAGIGDVGDVKSTVGAAGEVPGQKGIDVAEDYVAGFSLPAHAWRMLEQPADFQTAEVRAEWKPGLASKAVGPAVAGEFCDVIIYSGVLPDQGIGHRLAGFPVP